MAIIIDIFTETELRRVVRTASPVRSAQKPGAVSDSPVPSRGNFQQHCLAIAAICFVAGVLVLCSIVRDLP